MSAARTSRKETAAIMLFPLITLGGGAVGVAAVFLLGFAYEMLHAKLDPAGASDGAADIALTLLLSPIGFFAGLSLAAYLTIRFFMPKTDGEA